MDWNVHNYQFFNEKIIVNLIYLLRERERERDAKLWAPANVGLEA